MAHLDIDRAAMRSMKLFTVQRAALTLRKYDAGNLHYNIAPDVAERIREKLPAMQAAVDAIRADADLLAGINQVTAIGDVTAHTDPADNVETWNRLNEMAEFLYSSDAHSLNAVRTMLRKCVDLRVAASTEPACPDVMRKDASGTLLYELCSAGAFEQARRLLPLCTGLRRRHFTLALEGALSTGAIANPRLQMVSPARRRCAVCFTRG